MFCTRKSLLKLFLLCSFSCQRIEAVVVLFPCYLFHLAINYVLEVVVEESCTSIQFSCVEGVESAWKCRHHGWNRSVSRRRWFFCQFRWLFRNFINSVAYHSVYDKFQLYLRFFFFTLRNSKLLYLYLLRNVVACWQLIQWCLSLDAVVLLLLYFEC